MKLSVRAMVLTIGILWGGAVFITGLANLAWNEYGIEFLKVVASIYPGYKASGSFGDVITGTLYALVDGGVCGLILAWLYNRFTGKGKESKRK